MLESHTRASSFLELKQTIKCCNQETECYIWERQRAENIPLAWRKIYIAENRVTSLQRRYSNFARFLSNKKPVSITATPPQFRTSACSATTKSPRDISANHPAIFPTCRTSCCEQKLRVRPSPLTPQNGGGLGGPLSQSPSPAGPGSSVTLCPPFSAQLTAARCDGGRGGGSLWPVRRPIAQLYRPSVPFGFGHESRVIFIAPGGDTFAMPLSTAV